MKAIVFTEYGAPDVLQLKEVEKPQPAAHEILLKTHAAAANAMDWHLVRGEPFLARLMHGIRKPKNNRIGADIAGTVVAVGSDVTQFKVGDAVFGEKYAQDFGTFAEYAVISEEAVALKPENLSFEEAAAVPLAALTALHGLRNIGQLKTGQKVLVNGASGGVGTFAVQMAKAFGAEVTGVCSTRNLEMVRSIGADHVVDYTQEDFTRSGKVYDLIFDAVGNRSIADYKRVLSSNGICAIAGVSSMTRLFEHMLQGGLSSRMSDQTFTMVDTKFTNGHDLTFIVKLLQTAQIKSVIDRCYPLNETAEAIRYMETGRARGKVIIKVV